MANKPNRPKVPWESTYEIKEESIADFGGDIEVYVIYNKFSDTYYETWEKKTWYSHNFKDAKKAKSLYLKYQKTIEKALLK